MQSTAIPQGIRIDAMATRVPRPSPDASFMTSLRWFRGWSSRIGPAERVGSRQAREGNRPSGSLIPSMVRAPKAAPRLARSASSGAHEEPGGRQPGICSIIRQG
jgi:hypothetical protein